MTSHPQRAEKFQYKILHAGQTSGNGTEFCILRALLLLSLSILRIFPNPPKKAVKKLSFFTASFQ